MNNDDDGGRKKNNNNDNKFLQRTRQNKYVFIDFIWPGFALDARVHHLLSQRIYLLSSSSSFIFYV